MASLRLKLSLSYLAALSVEVLELIDAHYTIAVSYQDTVCLCREEQVLHADCGGGRQHYNWLPAEGHTEDPPTRLVWLNQNNQPTNQPDTGPAQADSHVQSQVPDLQLSLADGPKHRRLPLGPLDVLHGAMDAREGQQGTKVVPLPQMDGAVRGATQEDIRAEWRPSNSIHSTLGTTRKT